MNSVMDLYYRFDKEPIWERIPVEARRAEALGFDGISSVELNHDPFFQLVLAAQATKKVRLETRIAVAFPRSPTAMAYAAWDIQGLSHGRFKLGLGSQGRAQIEQRFAASWASPVPRLREYVAVIRSIWNCWQTGEPPDFNGEFYNVTLMPQDFIPGPIESRPPPIYLAAVGPRMARLAGEVADGVMCSNMSSRDYVKEYTLPLVAEGALAAGRTLKDIKVSTSQWVVTAPSRGRLKEAKAKVQRRVAFYACYSPLYQAVCKFHGWAEERAHMIWLTAQGRAAEVPDLVTDDMLETLSVIGLYDEVGSLIRARWEGISHELGLSLFLPPMSYRQESDALRLILRGMRQ